MSVQTQHCVSKNQVLATLDWWLNKMLKAVRASITTGVLSWITSRPKVVPLSSQYQTQSILLAEDEDFLVQEDGSFIILD
jgi:hypothetical protein